MSSPIRKTKPPGPFGERDNYEPSPILNEWLDGGDGRAAYFHHVDPILTPVLVSRLKAGRGAITFEYAIRLERAQKASLNPFKAVDIMTYPEDRELYRYVTGQESAPEQVKIVRKPMGPQRKPANTSIGAGT